MQIDAGKNAELTALRARVAAYEDALEKIAKMDWRKEMSGSKAIAVAQVVLHAARQRKALNQLTHQRNEDR